MKKMWIMNSFTSSCKVMASTVRINIVFLESQLTTTRIMSQPNKKKIFLIKIYEDQFLGLFRNQKLLEYSIGLIAL